MAKSETVTDLSDRNLAKEKIGLETDTVMAAAAKRGMSLKRELVYSLEERGVNLMKKLNFLEEYAKAGDPNEYLERLLAEVTKLTPAEAAEVSKVDAAIKRPLKTLTNFLEKHEALAVNVNAATLKELIAVANKLLAKIPAKED